MTAIKKSTTKTLKSPAPATKTGKPAAKKKTAARAATSAPTAFLASAPAVKAISPKALATTITAKIDVGFGNALYLRGEGPGLSWEKGVPMACVADDRWQAKLPETPRPVTVKFLVNDTTWSAGADYVVPVGGNITLTPSF
jgi:hypothetical protein